MLAALQKHILSQKLLSPGSHVLLAVSGGADSVFMMHVFDRMRKRLGLTLHVAHLNHGLRPEARRDATFVATEASALGIPGVNGRSNVKAHATREGISLEMAGRDARYAFFKRTARRIAREQNIAPERVVVVTAHTMNDQAETLLLRMARGASGAGLCGIAERRTHDGLTVVRPLLELPRDRIEAWLKRQGIAWREDASNRDDVFQRNRVRHEVLPVLKDRLNPQVVPALARTASLLREDEDWMEAMAKAILVSVVNADDRLDAASLSVHPAPARRRVLKLWLLIGLFPLDGADRALFARLDRLVCGSKGSQVVDLNAGWRVERQYDALVLRAPDSPLPDLAAGRVRLKRNAMTVIPLLALKVRIRATVGIARDATRRPGTLPATATLSAARVGRAALYVRTPRPGDRMRPLGMKGSQKLQDIFVNLKVPRADRARIPVLECRGEIVWVPGFRISEGWQARSKSAGTIEVTFTGEGV